MPALTDLPEIIGFFSYSREDDEDASNSLSTLRTRIQNELRARLGRSRSELRLWQDQEAIAPGTMWESQIELAVKQSVFFVPIITPRVINSKYCGLEFQRFLDRERELGRSDLVFPILYIDVAELEDEKLWRQHAVLKEIGSRQYVDWREYRYEVDSPALRRAVASFSSKIVAALQRSSPEVRPAAVVVDIATRERVARDAEDQRRAQAEEARQQQEEAERKRLQNETAARERAEAERLQQEEADRLHQAQEDARKRDEERSREPAQPQPQPQPQLPIPGVERSPIRSALEWGAVGAVSMVISGLIVIALSAAGTASIPIGFFLSLIFIIAVEGMFLRSGSSRPVALSIGAGAFVTRFGLIVLFSQRLTDPFVQVYFSNILTGAVPLVFFLLEPRLRSISFLKIMVVTVLVGALDAFVAVNGGMNRSAYLIFLYITGTPARFVIFALVGYELARRRARVN